MILRLLGWSLLLLGLLRGAASAQSAPPPFDLVQPVGTQVGSTAWGPVATSMATDSWGNVYLAGYYTGTVQLGSTTLSVSSSLPGWTKRSFLAKLDATGTYQWALDLDGLASTNPTHLLATDIAGNVYLAGYYEGASATFGPFQLSGAAGQFSLYLLKLAPDGSYQWARQQAGSTASADALTVDSNGNLYLTGGYQDASTTFGSIVLPNATPGHMSAFVAKLSAAGRWEWAARTVGTYGYEGEYGEAIAADRLGNLYVAGSFGSGTATFGTASLTGNNPYGFTSDGFVAKLDAAGQWQWARRVGGPGYDHVKDLGVDPTGSVVVHGTLHGPADANSWIQVPVRSGDFEVFVARLSPTGAVRWATSAGGTGVDLASHLTLDARGNTYVTGRFDSNPAYFGTALASNLNGQYRYEAYVAKLDTAGIWQWVQQSLGTDDTEGQGIVADPSGTVWLFGNSRSSSTAFSPLQLQQPGSFVARLGTASYATIVGGVVPASGSAGQRVTVTGAHFTGATGVYFNHVPASSFTVLSGSKLEAVVPAGASTGTVEVRTAAGGNGPAPVFQVVAPLAAGAAQLPAGQVWPVPVPSQRLLHLRLPAGWLAGQRGRATLHSALGAQVRTFELPAADAELSLQGLAAGCYVLLVQVPGQPPLRQPLVLE